MGAIKPAPIASAVANESRGKESRFELSTPRGASRRSRRMPLDPAYPARAGRGTSRSKDFDTGRNRIYNDFA
jgi:hypothetical protein